MTKKAPQAFRTISEVSDWLDTPAHVLRFWESKFSQIKPVKRAGGRRYYRPDDMLLLGGIKNLLHDDGITIKGVQKILKDKGVDHVQSMSPDLELLDIQKRRGKKRKAGKVNAAAETGAGMQAQPAAKSEIASNTKDESNAAAGVPTPDTAETITASEAVDTVTIKASAPDTGPSSAAMQPQKNEAVADELSSEESARRRIAEAVSRQVTSSTPDSATKNASQENAARLSLSVAKRVSDLSDDTLLEIEELYYRLRKLRNRVRRAIEAL